MIARKVGLVKIVIKIDGTVTELTIDDAKKLYNQLDSIFGEKLAYLPPTNKQNGND